MAAIKLTPDEFHLLRDAIEEVSAIRVGSGKTYLIESRLSSLLKEYDCASYQDLYYKLKNSPNSGLRAKVIDAMSTQETLWFRDTHPYKIFGEKLLPEYANDVQERKRSKIRIWSAASSTGQEPYSLAMVILDKLKTDSTLKPYMFEILATDIASSAIDVAKGGLYDRMAMGRGLPASYRSQHFTDDGRYARISDEVRKFVTFKQFNLMDSFASIGKYDLVLCRNVAIYFSDEFKRELYRKITKVLLPGGHLILGASESISAHSSDYNLLDYNRGLYYRVKSA
ncbi:MAG: protein-glutamate O-methyltransferase CheR [Candidatus Eisenbacteria sp.]|nr:protein-glutamate O-methyltransferase CheR [Candidatus Eisenbacteria bacterium]